MKLIPLEVLTPDKVMRMVTGVIVGLTLLSGVLLHFWAIDALHYLPGISLCPFHVITGIACPGCGMARAFLTLGQLNLQQAIELNPFSLPLFSVMLLYLWLGYIPRLLRQKVFLRLSIPAVVTLWLFHLLGK
jgi:hypothetical protein